MKHPLEALIVGLWLGFLLAVLFAPELRISAQPDIGAYEYQSEWADYEIRTPDTTGTLRINGVLHIQMRRGRFENTPMSAE